MEHKNSLGSRLQIRKIERTPLFPTLFSKLVTVYLGILVGILLFFSVIFSNAFQSYYVEYTADIMFKQAKTIAKEYETIVELGRPTEEIIDKVVYKIQTLNSYLDATTWLIDKNNNVIVSSATEKDTSALERKIPKQEYINTVFEGKMVTSTRGFEAYFSTPVLTIGYPIIIFGQVERALFIHTPMPQILKTIDEVRMIIVKVVGITSALTFILIYFLSKQMTKSLKEMNQVAKQIASGSFDKRITVKGIDEISQLGESLNYMAGELEKIEQTRKSFIANVSHDMRSPLTSIQGFITAILDGTVPPDKQEKYLKIVLSESQRMIKMSNDILALNKLEEGNLPLKKMSFDVHEMIKDLLSNFEALTQEKQVTVNLILDKKEQIVFADPEKIVRVVQNLLDNAFKFVNIGGTIEIETLCKNNKVWVHIRNSGKVIPKQEQHDIWERFYKSDLSRGKDKKGMGIGLVIVKEIIKQHREEIGVRSEEGELVTFYFSLSKNA